MSGPPKTPTTGENYNGDTAEDAKVFEDYNKKVMAWQFGQMSEQIYWKALLKDATGSVIVTNLINPSQNS